MAHWWLNDYIAISTFSLRTLYKNLWKIRLAFHFCCFHDSKKTTEIKCFIQIKLTNEHTQNKIVLTLCTELQLNIDLNNIVMNSIKINYTKMTIKRIKHKTKSIADAPGDGFLYVLLTYVKIIESLQKCSLCF